MKSEDKRTIEQYSQAEESLARSREEDQETQVYFIAPGYLTKFDRDCGDAANLASVYVIDAHNTPVPGLHLAPDSRQGQIDEQSGRLAHGTVQVHPNALNFLLVPAKKQPVEDGEPVLIFLMYKSVFTHPGLAPYAHRPAFAHALSRFIDVQVMAG